MPRQNRRRVDAPNRAPAGGGERREDWNGEPYSVRAVVGSASGKAYRCPGCDQEMRADVPHVVSWPAGDLAAENRRHWHSSCWSARARRSPGVQRSRSAPRY